MNIAELQEIKETLENIGNVHRAVSDNHAFSGGHLASIRQSLQSLKMRIDAAIADKEAKPVGRK